MKKTPQKTTAQNAYQRAPEDTMSCGAEKVAYWRGKLNEAYGMTGSDRMGDLMPTYKQGAAGYNTAPQQNRAYRPQGAGSQVYILYMPQRGASLQGSMSAMQGESGKSGDDNLDTRLSEQLGAVYDTLARLAGDYSTGKNKMPGGAILIYAPSYAQQEQKGDAKKGNAKDKNYGSADILAQQLGLLGYDKTSKGTGYEKEKADNIRAISDPNVISLDERRKVKQGSETLLDRIAQERLAA